jgi:hypothetical protein
MKTQELINSIKDLVVGMSQQQQADLIWSIISETTLKDATMNRVDGGYEIVLEMDEEDEDQGVEEDEDQGVEEGKPGTISYLLFGK